MEVECLATKIPEAINVDISGLEIGDAVVIADLTLPPEVKILEDHSTPVVSVSVAVKVAEDTAALAEEEKEEEGRNPGNP